MLRRMLLFLALCAVPALGAQEPAATRPAPLAIEWDQARAHVGHDCLVSGRIAAARTLQNRCFLNFHEDYRKYVAVMIPREAFAKFTAPPEQLYANQTVQVRGVINEFQGRLQIVVEAPDQIQIVEAAASQPSTQPEGAVSDRDSAAPTSRPFVGHIKVATYNVLNLFDGVDDPYHADEGTPTKPVDELARVAASIRGLDADVLALEEVENRGILEQFVRTSLADMAYEHVVLFEGNDERGIDVALLSRLPVGPVTSYRHLKFQRPDGTTASFERDLLRARIEPPDSHPLDVFVVHLKSKRGADGNADPTLTVRLGEAQAIRRIFDELLAADPKARFLICGDFNDRLDSLPLRTLIGDGDAALRTWAEDLPTEQRISYNKEPHRSMIDFILCSPALAASYQAGSYTIAPGSVETSGSDHNPVSAVFDLRHKTDSDPPRD